MQNKASADYVTIYTDRYGVKHIAPYSFHYQMTSGKKMDSGTAQMIGKQEAKVFEYSNKRK